MLAFCGAIIGAIISSISGFKLDQNLQPILTNFGVGATVGAFSIDISKNIYEACRGIKGPFVTKSEIKKECSWKIDSALRDLAQTPLPSQADSSSLPDKKLSGDFTANADNTPKQDNDTPAGPANNVTHRL